MSFFVDTKIVELLRHGGWLWEVLYHLMDDGLHECRLVCRQWYDICNALPLKISRIQQDELPRIQQLFPNIESLAVSLAREDPSSRERRPVDVFFDRCATLPGLKRLEVEFPGAVSSSSAVEFRFVFLNQLESLAVHFDRNSQFASNVASGFRFLIRLKSLKITAEDPRLRLSVERFTGLRLLRELECRFDLLFREDEEMLFPTLSTLTRLSLEIDGSTDFRRLERFPPLALRALSVHFGPAVQQTLHWRVFGCSTGLESISLTGDGFDAYDFLIGLRRFALLRELNIQNVDSWTPGFGDAVLALANVESVSLNLDSEDGEVMYDGSSASDDCSCPRDIVIEALAHSTQLTRLHLVTDMRIIVKSFWGLKELHVVSHGELEQFLDLPPLLESLTVVDRGAGDLLIPISAIYGAGRLRSLCLSFVRVDSRFFESLVWLPDLTRLKFEFRQELPADLLREIGCLTDLRDLSISFPARASADYGLEIQRTFVKGEMVRLRHLEIRTRPSKSGEAAKGPNFEFLKKKLPSLRKLTVI